MTVVLPPPASLLVGIVLSLALFASILWGVVWLIDLIPSGAAIWVEMPDFPTNGLKTAQHLPF